jgi:hypothetical protein
LARPERFRGRAWQAERQSGFRRQAEQGPGQRIGDPNPKAPGIMKATLRSVKIRLSRLSTYQIDIDTPIRRNAIHPPIPLAIQARRLNPNASRT